MKSNSNEMSTGAALLLTIVVMLLIGWIVSAFEPKCSMSSCDRDAREGERYCYLHEMSYRSYGNPDYNAVYKNAQKNKTKTTSTSTDASNSSLSGTSNSKKTTTTKKKAYNTYDSYDAGYEDVYDNDDYDWDRYYRDDDYADGVDDAMEDLDW